MSAMAVKKLIKSPIDFLPSMISMPPKTITPKKPKAATKSIRAGIPATPNSAPNHASLVLSITLLSRSFIYFSIPFNFIDATPWKASSSSVVVLAEEILDFLEIECINFCNNNIGMIKIGNPNREIIAHFQSIQKATVKSAARDTVSLPSAITIWTKLT